MKQQNVTKNDTCLDEYICKLNKYKVPSSGENLALAYLSQAGAEYGKEQLLYRNWRIIYKLAKNIATTDDEIMDYIQIGNIALLKAAELFDFSQKIEFMTYAIKCIDCEMKTYKTKNSAILSGNPHSFLLGKKISKKVEEIENETFEDICRSFGISEMAGKSLLDFYNSKNAKSIEATICDASDAIYEDEITNDCEKIDTDSDMDKEIENIALCDTINECLKVLTEKQRIVITKIFGLNGNLPLTQKQLAIELDCSPQNIGVIKDKALRRLRHSKNAKNLEIFYE